MSSTFNPDELRDLEHLIDINTDVIEFYAAAQDRVDNISLKETCRVMANLHLRTIMRLKSMTSDHSFTEKLPQSTEKLIKATKRFFAEIAVDLSSQPVPMLIKKLEVAEARCLLSMESTFQNKETSVQTKAVLEQELENLRKGQTYLKLLKQTLAA